MRRDVRKYLFYGAAEDRDQFFRRAQRKGLIEFINPARTMAEQPPQIGRLIAANKVLRRLEPLPQEELDDWREADRIAERIVILEETIERLEEELRTLDQEIARVKIFGDFSSEDLEYIKEHGRRVFQFFFAKHGSALDLLERAELFYVGTAHELDYFAAVNQTRTSYPGLIEMRIEEPLGVLVKRKRKSREELRIARLELKQFASRKAFLGLALMHHLNTYHLLASQDFSGAELDGAVFTVEGWIPKHREGELQEICDELSIFYDEIRVEEGDHVPTYLENDGLSRVGEDLVHIYDIPSTTDRDPSNWVLWFFALFFAMIVGDAGYGLVFLGLTLVLKWKFGKKRGSMARFIRLGFILSSFCIIWGVLITSYFGVNIGPDSSLQKVSLTNWLVRAKVDYAIDKQGDLYADWVEKYPELAQETTVDGWIHTAVEEKEGKLSYELFERFANSVLLELALMVGALHIILSFLRVIDRNWAGIGWILAIVGGYLFFPSLLDATSLIHFVFRVPETGGAVAGLELLGLGIGLAIVLALIQKRKGGLAEVTVSIQVFADILSYLRLYALGLASALMSVTFNDIGATAGVVFGTLIIIVGQSVNLVLAVMGGVIHGLRLNFLEWYHHCFEGGGRLLRPLRLLGLEPK